MALLIIPGQKRGTFAQFDGSAWTPLFGNTNKWVAIFNSTTGLWEARAFTGADLSISGATEGDLLYYHTGVWDRLAVGAAGTGLVGGTDPAYSTSPRYSGYGRYGSSSASTTTTAGYITAEGLVIPDQTLPAVPGLITLKIPSAVAGTPTLLIYGDDHRPRIELRGYTQRAQYAGLQGGGSLASPSATALGSTLVELSGGGFDNAGTPARSIDKAQFKAVAVENWTTTAQGTYWIVSTTAAGATTVNDRHYFFDSGATHVGYLGVGYSTTPPTHATNGDFSASTAVYAPIVDAATGFRVNAAATSGHFLRGNGTNYVDGAIVYSDLGLTNNGDLLSVSGGVLARIAAPAAPAVLKTGGTNTIAAWGTIDNTYIDNRVRSAQVVMYDFTNSVAVPASDAHGSVGGVAHYHLVDAADSYLISLYNLNLPADYVSTATGLALVFEWSTSVGGNNVVFYKQAYSHTDGGTTEPTLFSATGSTVAAPAAANTTTRTSFALTTAPAASTTIAFVLGRTGTSGSDSNTGQVSVYSVWLEYTADS